MRKHDDDKEIIKFLLLRPLYAKIDTDTSFAGLRLKRNTQKTYIMINLAKDDKNLHWSSLTKEFYNENTNNLQGPIELDYKLESRHRRAEFDRDDDDDDNNTNDNGNIGHDDDKKTLMSYESEISINKDKNTPYKQHGPSPHDLAALRRALIQQRKQKKPGDGILLPQDFTFPSRGSM